MPVKVGVPRALHYYSHYPFWKTFLEDIGAKVILSPETNNTIVDHATSEAPTDLCMPIKIFCGHVLSLKDQVDYLFIPRFVSIDRRFTFCPKFLGLPDIVRHSLGKLPEIIDTRIDLRKGRLELFRVCRRIGKRLGAGLLEVLRAYRKARGALSTYQRQLLHMPVREALSGKTSTNAVHSNADLIIAVLGYPYLVHDEHINMGLVPTLREMGVRVLTFESIPKRDLEAYSRTLPKNVFWYYSNKVIFAALCCLDRGLVDGIIHLTAFACGPDAIADKIIELESYGKVPFLSLSLDEHSAEAGLQTRLEAFVDMIRRRKRESA